MPTGWDLWKNAILYLELATLRSHRSGLDTSMRRFTGRSRVLREAGVFIRDLASGEMEELVRLRLQGGILVTLLILTVTAPVLVDLATGGGGTRPSKPMGPRGSVSVATATLLSATAPSARIDCRARPRSGPMCSCSRRVPLSHRLRRIVRRTYRGCNIPCTLTLTMTRYRDDFHLRTSGNAY